MEDPRGPVPCRVDGCDQTVFVFVHGYCKVHYSRWSKGRPLDLYRMNESERFWSKVDKETSPEGCWNWTGTRNYNGHERFSIGRKMAYAHRYSYEVEHGPVPEGLVVDHKCRNRGCVNPDHLQAVTPAENGQNRGIDSRNSTGYRGVSWDKRSSKYIAQVRFQGRTNFCGYYDRAEDAAAAARAKRLELYSNNVYDE